MSFLLTFQNSINWSYTNSGNPVAECSIIFRLIDSLGVPDNYDDGWKTFFAEGNGSGCGRSDDYSYRSADFYAPNFSVTMTETTYDGEYYESNEVWHHGRGYYYYYNDGYLYSGSTPSSHSPSGSAPNAPSSYGSITVAGIPLNYNGNPNFNNYTYVDPEAILDEKYPKPTEPTVPEAAEPPVTPVWPTAPAQPQNSWSDWLNNGINNFFFNTTINPDNENFKQIREQNDIANQVAGTAVHPDRGTWEDAKNLAGTVSGAGAFINGLEQATNTDNSTFDRLMGGISAGLSVTGAIGTVAAAEGRMCGLVSCFTAGTQVVTGENTIESACGTEIVMGQSFDSSNIVFAGLGIGVTAVFLSSLRKERERNELKDKRKLHEDQDMNKFEKISESEVGVLNTELKATSRFSWRKWILLPLLFVLIILCGYFALPTTKNVAVSTGTASIEKRYVTKNIEDIQVGDEVYAFDIETNETVKRRVTNVLQRTSDHLRYLTVHDSNETQVFETTDSHPFWVVTDTPDLSRAAQENVTDNGVWLHHENVDVTEHGYYVEAGNLRVGDIFISPHGKHSTLEKTERTEYPNGITVYNFEVEDNHNYFVIANPEAFQNGAEPVLVHNADCLTHSERRAIQSIVNRIGKPIHVVGSRASGTLRR